jgi:6-phosphogluconolactonase
MQKAVLGLLAAALSAAACTPMLHADNRFNSSSTVFVLTNNADKNEVLTYRRLDDGSLALTRRVATGGRGSGGTTDPLQSQGSLTLSQDRSLLFAINAGSGTVSSFRLLNGFPILVDKTPAEGAFPVAVAEHNHIVYVLNAGGNGAVTGFRADGFGRLHQISQPTVHLTATNDGGSAITISPDGRTLVVIEKGPNNIDTFPIHPDGTLGPVKVNRSVTPGVFAAVFAPTGTLIISENQPGGTNVSSVSSYLINADGTITAISQSLPSQGDGNCWNAITPKGQFVYFDNSASASVAGFSVGANGALKPIAGTILSTEPEGAANLDMSVSGDGKYLYTLNSGLGTVGVLAINSDGTLKDLGEIGGLPKTAGFNGIAAL